MIRRLFIANRGEIAVRVIRTCREMGIETVAAYSEADRDGLAARLADEAVCIGPAPAAKSYLSVENLIMAALRTGCDSLHPGAGFLSENADFAGAVEKAGLLFIGPAPETLALLGNKVRAREQAAAAGLPVLPSWPEAADGLPYPVIIKAALGGGGKGMRVVREAATLAENLALASAEALTNFGDGAVYIEKYLEKPRHIELQILGDGKGGIAVLGERDCSIQERRQKLIEESPAPRLEKEIYSLMEEGARRLFGGLDYRGAGTIEFLLEGGKFYFMEVNPRIQVEHPVTECVTGIDIIREQILACAEGRLETGEYGASGASGASGAGGAFGASGIPPRGIECRINAAGPGRITALEVPGGPGVRFDSYLRAGCTVPPSYDGLLAKLIVHAQTRDRAIAKMERALGELAIEGIATNRERQLAIIRDPAFRAGEYDVTFCEKYQEG